MLAMTEKPIDAGVRMVSMQLARMRCGSVAPWAGCLRVSGTLRNTVIVSTSVMVASNPNTARHEIHSSSRPARRVASASFPLPAGPVMR